MVKVLVDLTVHLAQDDEYEFTRAAVVTDSEAHLARRVPPGDVAGLAGPAAVRRRCADGPHERHTTLIDTVMGQELNEMSLGQRKLRAQQR